MSEPRIIDRLGTLDPLVLSPRTLENCGFPYEHDDFNCYNLYAPLEFRTDDGTFTMGTNCLVRIPRTLGTRGLASPAKEFMDYDENRHITFVRNSALYFHDNTAQCIASNVTFDNTEMWLSRKAVFDDVTFTDSWVAVDGYAGDYANIMLRQVDLKNTKLLQTPVSGPVVIDFSGQEYHTLENIVCSVEEQGLHITSPDHYRVVADGIQRATIHRQGNGTAGITLWNTEDYRRRSVSLEDVPDTLRDKVDEACQSIVAAGEGLERDPVFEIYEKNAQVVREAQQMARRYSVRYSNDMYYDLLDAEQEARYSFGD